MAGDSSAQRLRQREVLSYGIADLSQTAAVQFASMYLLFFYTDILALGAAVVGTVFAFSRLWDAVNDPLMGIIVDHTHTRFGRCRPYLIPGSIVLMIAMLLAFSEVPLEGAALLIYVIIGYNLFNMAYTATNLPLTAQLPLMTADPRQRVRLSATRAFFQAIAYAAVPLLAEPVLSAFGGHRVGTSYTFLAVAMGAFVVISFVAAFYFTQERVDLHTQKIGRHQIRQVFLGQSDWLVLTLVNVLVSVALVTRVSSAIYHFNYVVADMAWFGAFMALSTLSMIPCSIAAGYFSSRIGKRSYALLGCGVGLLGNLIIISAPENPVLLLLGGMLGGCAVGAFISVLFAMEGDIADRVKARTQIHAQAMICA